MAIVLIAKRVNGESAELKLEGKIYIGRKSGCNYVFPEDEKMSGKHGSLQMGTSGEIIYTDVGSSNGSFLNGDKVVETKIKTGQTLKLGNTLFTIDASRLTAEEKARIEGDAAHFEIGEDKTTVITNADLFLRPQFEKTAVGKKTSLSERWNLGTDVLDSSDSDDEDDEKTTLAQPKVDKKVKAVPSGLELDRKSKK